MNSAIQDRIGEHPPTGKPAVERLIASRRAILAAVPMSDDAVKPLVDRESETVERIIATPGNPDLKALLLAELIEIGDFEELWRPLAISIVADHDTASGAGEQRRTPNSLFVTPAVTPMHMGVAAIR